MSMQYTPPNLIGATNASVSSSFLPPMKYARAAGSIIKYEYKSNKPKKQLKELIKVLWPERKSFLGIKYGYKFNAKDRCVVCGTHKVWDVSDPSRPTIPLHKVRKGYPMRGTYCEEHGLSFSAYVPKPKMPKMLESAPLTSLRRADIETLAAAGWTIKPPQMAVETAEDELFRLTMESHAINNRVFDLMTNGTKVIQETKEEEENGLGNK